MKGYSIIKADVKDNKEDIIQILNRNLEENSAQSYEWKYENCPYGVAHCWLAKHEKSESFVGTTAIFPRNLIIKGEPVSTAIISDFAIDIKHRVYGPSLKLQKEIQSSLRNTGFRFVIGVSTNLSELLFLKIGYKKIGMFNSYIKVFKTEHLLKEYLPSCLHFKMIFKIMDFFIKIISKEKYYKKTFEYSIEMPEFFDDRFDAFWKKVRKQFNIIGERNSNFLNWRYKQSSAEEYKIFCILDEKKDIAGYIVYFFKDNICQIVDMLFIKSKRDILDSLLAEFSLYVQEMGMESINISCLSNDFLGRKFKKFNFFSLKKGDRNVLIYGPDFSSEFELLDEDNWHFIVGDDL